jgi:6-aminohexanoate-oligomer endohydrolase
MQSNDHFSLQPRTDLEGRQLTFDFPGLLIGSAEYDEGPTGCTVFRFPQGVSTAVDVRGGWVGMTQAFEFCHAVCLTAGSLLGLEAVAGVMSGILAENAYSLEKGLPVVNGAVIYDYGRRQNLVYPDKALGRAAFEAAKPGVFLLGARGAGRSAGVGGALDRSQREASGQGGAFRQVGDVKIAVFTVANPLGAIIDRTGRVVRGNLDQATGERATMFDALERRLAAGETPRTWFGNTTLSLVVTNQKLDAYSLTQLGRQVHSSMARAIQPFHTVRDGDVLYTVTTDAVESSLDTTSLGVLASELAWDAVLSAVE